MDSLIVFCAKYIIFFVPLLWLITWYRQSPQKRKSIFIVSAVSGLVALALAVIASKLYYDPRPFTHGNIKALFPHGPDNGFPSDHSWVAMTIAVVTYLYNRQLGYWALALTLIIGISRVAAHVHSPIDIIGGFAIGIIAAYAGRWLVKQFKLA